MAAKVSKKSVRYRAAWPFARRRCGSCVMFRPPTSTAIGAPYEGSCTLVEGDILRLAVCDRWEAKP